MAPIVFVYGFPPRMDIEDFRAEFFESVDEQAVVSKIDFKADKIFAFIHTNTLEQAQDLIDRWDGKPMKDSGDNKLQVRLKNEPTGGQGGHGGQGGQGNMGNNNSNIKSPGNHYNNGQNQGGYMNRNHGGNRGGHMGGNNNNRNNNYNNQGQGGNNHFNNQNNGGNHNFGNNNGGNNNMGNNRNNNNGPRNNNYGNNQQNNHYGNQNNNQMGGNGPHGQGGFNKQNNNKANTEGLAASLGPQKPVLYVYGFPKDMEQETFENEFLADYSDKSLAHKQTDYFKEKLYCFIHCHNTETCDELIEKWDQKTMPGNEGNKPLQVRYKGMDSRLVQMLQSINPVLWVYGFPKNMTEEDFRMEFLAGNEVEKIDYFEAKLYAFVHCRDHKQCIKFINKWDGKQMSKSKTSLQVRFKNIPNKTTTYFNNNQAMGDMPNQVYNQTFNNNNQYYNNMQMQRPNAPNNMQNNYMQQQPMYNNAMNQNFQQRPGNNMYNNVQRGGNWNNQHVQNNMPMGDFNNMGFKGRGNQGNFNRPPHQNNQYQQMNDGNQQFRNNQHQGQQMQYGGPMINNRR